MLYVVLAAALVAALIVGPRQFVGGILLNVLKVAVAIGTFLVGLWILSYVVPLLFAVVAALVIFGAVVAFFVRASQG